MVKSCVGSPHGSCPRSWQYALGVIDCRIEGHRLWVWSSSTSAFKVIDYHNEGHCRFEGHCRTEGLRLSFRRSLPHWRSSTVVWRSLTATWKASDSFWRSLAVIVLKIDCNIDSPLAKCVTLNSRSPGTSVAIVRTHLSKFCYTPRDCCGLQLFVTLPCSFFFCVSSALALLLFFFLFFFFVLSTSSSSLSFLEAIFDVLWEIGVFYKIWSVIE